jgi:hypothetical protein
MMKFAVALRLFVSALLIWASASAAFAQPANDTINLRTGDGVSRGDFNISSPSIWTFYGGISLGSYSPGVYGNPGPGAGSMSSLPLAVVNIQWLGADTTGGADVCPSVLPAAISELPSTGGTLYFPKGTYLFATCNLAVSNKPVAIVGDGAGITTFNFTNNTAGDAGISISENASQAVHLHGISLYSTVAQSNGNSCISVSYSNTGQTPTSSFDDFECLTPGQAYYWNYGLAFKNVSYSQVSNFLIVGTNQGNVPGGISFPNMVAGIHLSGNSTSNHFTSGHVLWGSSGSYASGDSERNYYDAVDMVADNYGWFNDDGSTSGDATSIPNAPGPSIVNSHADVYTSAVYLKGWTQTTLSNDLFYHRVYGTGNFIALAFENGTYGGTAYGSTENSATGVTIEGNYNQSGCSCSVLAVQLGSMAGYNYIVGNHLNNLSTAFDGGGASLVNYFYDNTWLVPSTWVINTGISVFYNNFPWDSVSQFLAANSATPSVAGLNTSIINTHNTGATSVTGFTNTYSGQVFTIVAGDSNTTLVTSSTLILNGGINYAMTIGDNITFQIIGTQARELSRQHQ